MPRIPLTQGKFTIVDEADYQWAQHHLWAYCVSGGTPQHSYAVRWVLEGGHKYLLNLGREILGLTYQDGLWCRYKNGNTLDNRRKNLQVMRRGQSGWPLVERTVRRPVPVTVKKTVAARKTAAARKPVRKPVTA